MCRAPSQIDQMKTATQHLFSLILLLSALLLIVPGQPVSAGSTDDPEAQRELFREIYSDLKRGRSDSFKQKGDRLKEYLLYPYLLYEKLDGQLNPGKRSQLLEFFERWPDSHLTSRLRNDWLELLAKKERWQEYLEFYVDDGDTGRHCHKLVAELNSLGESGAMIEQIESIWLHPHSRPTACDPLFVHLENSGRLDESLVMRRIELAMEERELSLVTYLARKLPAESRRRVTLWQRIHRHPARELARLRPADDAWSARMFRYGITRLARRDAASAYTIWQERAAEFHHDEAEIVALEEQLAMRLARDRDPRSFAITLGENPSIQTLVWQLRNALWNGEWQQALKLIDRLPESSSERDDWQYWRARALEESGEQVAASQLYRSLTNGNGYYAFLAAERLGDTPRLYPQPLSLDQKALAAVAAIPAIARAEELYRLGYELEATREWYHTQPQLDELELQAAAKLADSWGWHHRAILTIARTDTLGDLELRFPTPFRQQILDTASQRDLDPAMVYAVIRQESAFKRDARSPAGALGLMQLMPATARQTGRLIKRPIRNKWDILDVPNNLHLGVSHLKHLLKRYDENRVFTAAAYNAGPHRVRRWQPEDEMRSADVWIEAVPFGETRNYIKRILSYTLIYEWRLGRPQTPLSRHMPGIAPRS